MQSEAKEYVMFGFNKADIEQTGYFGENLDVVHDKDLAKVFRSKKGHRQKGFKKPEVWLKLINDDEELSKGWKFHLIAMKKPQAERKRAAAEKSQD